MRARRRALEAFSGGLVWKEHASAANATMIDSDNVLLLRPLEGLDARRVSELEWSSDWRERLSPALGRRLDGRAEALRLTPTSRVAAPRRPGSMTDLR